MSGRKKKPERRKPKEVAHIKYLEPHDVHETYASGARLLIMSPIHVQINFFWDKLVDDIAGESITENEKGERSQRIERAYDGGRQVVREIVSSITLPVPAFLNLADAMQRVARGIREDEVTK